MADETFPDLFRKRETLVGLFLLGVVLVPVGFVIFNAGKTVMECSPEATSSPGIEEIYGGILVVTDGCNLYEIPFLSLAGGVLVVLIVGYTVVGLAR